MLRPLLCVAAFLFLCAASLFAMSDEQREEMQKKLDGLHYKTGQIVINGGLATVDVPDTFAFLDAKDSKTLLTDIWRNPPDDSVLGTIVPKDFGRAGNSWAVVLSYDESGYVSEKDAGKINYNDLLAEMQTATRDSNAQREKEGYPPIDLIGWAAPPHYDATTHKLYWAREIKFGDHSKHTLNYAIRVLGRRGVLQLNAVAGMDQLPVIEKEMPAVLEMVNFKEGNRYVDFDPKIDKVAGYGLAALIVGGIAAKAGLFKGLFVLLLAAKKFVIVGAVALWAAIRKLFKRKEPSHPLSETNP